MQKPELLAPAGDLEKLKMAVLYGADAVYMGGTKYGLRAFANNFNLGQMEEGINFAHQHGVKVYVTVNIIPHNEDLVDLPNYLKLLSKLRVDAIIVSDPGVIRIAKETVPDLPLHLSTQANCTNWAAAKFWADQGISRIILARELSLKEIKEIRSKLPDIQLETFVHGAMCISYSGRCLLSNYLAGRDANRGECAQACRWNYRLMEEKRPGEYLPVFEDERGTYIFNSKDLNMLEYIPQLVRAGINSFKIEGRMKSVYYVATVVRAYRQCLDAYFNDPDNYKPDPELIEELNKVSHREYFTGFFFGKPGSEGQIYQTSSYIRSHDFVGLVKEYLPDKKMAIVEQRNRFKVLDEIEFVSPNLPSFKQIIKRMWNEEKELIAEAPHPQQILIIEVDNPVEPYTMLRKRKE
ncbi:MAG TPA: U32 family peptidase [Clostridia bacterium]|nr:U32 family peptidase [Clostridia bacterium]